MKSPWVADRVSPATDRTRTQGHGRSCVCGRRAQAWPRLGSLLLVAVMASARAALGQSPVSDLPLTEFPANDSTPYFVVFITGDGGVKEFVDVVAGYLQMRRVSLVALDAQKYFWSEKKPAAIAADLVRTEDYYLRKWNKRSVVYMGYSMGADVLPFALNAMADRQLATVHDVILIAPAQKAVFVITVSGYLHDGEEGADVYPELRRLRLKRVFCIADDSKHSVGRLDLRNVVDYVVLPGGHHFGHDYKTLCAVIGRRLGLE